MANQKLELEKEPRPSESEALSIRFSWIKKKCQNFIYLCKLTLGEALNSNDNKLTNFFFNPLGFSNTDWDPILDDLIMRNFEILKR